MSLSSLYETGLKLTLNNSGMYIDNNYVVFVNIKDRLYILV
jgi:hypothetical protein